MSFIKGSFIPILSLGLIGATHRAIGQSSIDTFISGLHNKDAKSVVVLALRDFRRDTAKVKLSVAEREVRSIDCNEVKKVYPKYLMVSKLVELMNDSDRDWYADLLLYSLTDEPSVNIINCDTREKWLQIKKNSNMTYKDVDVAFWRHYLAGLSPSVQSWR